MTVTTLSSTEKERSSAPAESAKAGLTLQEKAVWGVLALLFVASI